MTDAEARFAVLALAKHAEIVKDLGKRDATWIWLADLLVAHIPAIRQALGDPLKSILPAQGSADGRTDQS